jgi:hypothetical protein
MIPFLPEDITLFDGNTRADKAGFAVISLGHDLSFRVKQFKAAVRYIEQIRSDVLQLLSGNNLVFYIQFIEPIFCGFSD